MSRAPLNAPLATNRNRAAGHAKDLTRRCFTASAATSAVGLKPASPDNALSEEGQFLLNCQLSPESVLANRPQDSLSLLPDA